MILHLDLMHFSKRSISLCDYIHTKYYKRIANVVLNSSVFSSRQGLLLSETIKELALLKCGEGIANELTEQRVEAEEFLDLYFSTWYSSVHAVLSKQHNAEKERMHALKPADLNEIIKTDFLTFTHFLNREISVAISRLPNGLERLKKFVLSALALPNRRQFMDIQNLSISSFKTAKAGGESSVEAGLLHDLSIEEIIKGLVAFVFIVFLYQFQPSLVEHSQ